ncbi:hypothetical protein LOD99_10679 [Oopsacas minuta]|uniref:CWF21 domain-containing protein n=1 Tax=Oopsacas minuta TaxID=111878 RepID=A0AAV7KF98_9METZ|nr:hypothetical protein LOD99_10679 [Oopsacas minuta]
MYNNIGLPTPRGSGTNGHIQRNFAAVRPVTSSRGEHDTKERGLYGKKTSHDIQEHNRKRLVHVKCLELKDQLEREGLSVNEIEIRVKQLSSELIKDITGLERKWVDDDNAVAREKQRKWREALNPSETQSGSQESNRRKQAEVSSGRSGARTHTYSQHHRESSEDNSEQLEQSDNDSSSTHSRGKLSSPGKDCSHSSARVSSPRREHLHSRAKVPSIREQSHSRVQIPSPRREHAHSRVQMPSPRRVAFTPHSEPPEIGGEVESHSESEEETRDKRKRKHRNKNSGKKHSHSLEDYATKGHNRRHNSGTGDVKSKKQLRERCENVSSEVRHKTDKKKSRKEKERKFSKQRRHRNSSPSEDSSSNDAILSPPPRKLKKKFNKKRQRDRSVSEVAEDTIRHKRHKKKKIVSSRKKRHISTSETTSASDTSDSEDTSELSISQSETESSEVTPPPKPATKSHKRKKSKKNRKIETSLESSDYESPKKKVKRHKRDTIYKRRHKHRKNKKKLSAVRKHKKRRAKRRESSSQSDSDSEASVQEFVEVRHSRKKRRNQDTESEIENVKNVDSDYEIESNADFIPDSPGQVLVETETEISSDSQFEVRRTHRDTKHKKHVKLSKRHNSKSKKKRGVKWHKMERKRSVSSSEATSSDEIEHQKETATQKGVKRRRRDPKDSDVELTHKTADNVSKKKQRIERHSSSSSEQPSIPDIPAVAMEEAVQSSEETFHQVPVVAKRRPGKKGMLTGLFGEQGYEDKELTNERREDFPVQRFMPAESPTPQQIQAPLGTELWSEKWNVSGNPWLAGTEGSVPVSYPCPSGMFGPALPIKEPEIAEQELIRRTPSSSSKSQSESHGDSDMSMSPASERKVELEPSGEDRVNTPEAETADPMREQQEVLSEKSQSIHNTENRAIPRASSLSSLSSRHSRGDRIRRRSPRRSPDRWRRRSRERSHRRYRTPSRSRSRSYSPNRWKRRRSRSRSSSRGYRHYDRRRQFGRYDDRHRWSPDRRDSRDRWGRRGSYERVYGGYHSRYDSRDRDWRRRRENSYQRDRFVCLF